MIAIIIACSPSFAVFIRKSINTKKSSYNADGYVAQVNEDIKLKSMASSSSRPKRNNRDVYWDDTHSSQEELARSSQHIVVTTTVQLANVGTPYKLK